MAIRAPERIETERLVLRRSRAADGRDIFHAYAQDPEVTRYMSWRTLTDISQANEFVRRCHEVWEAGTAFPYVITDGAGGVLMGMIEVRIDGHRAEIGYVLAQPYWGAGRMTEALRAVAGWASSLEGIHRVWAYCDVENRASWRVMEKAGMTREGTVRRWAVMPNLGDTPRDCHLYSLP